MPVGLATESQIVIGKLENTVSDNHGHNERRMSHLEHGDIPFFPNSSVKEKESDNNVRQRHHASEKVNRNH